MSFDIQLKTNNSPDNQISKSLTSMTTLTGVLRAGASVLDPIVEIEMSDDSAIIKDCNYAYIPTFGRYYFITDVRSTVNGLWQVSLHVDVLMTYKEQIRAQHGVVSRSKNMYNMYLDDGWFVDYQNPYIKVVTFPNDRAFEHQEYVLVLAGNTGAINNGGGE